MIKEIFMNKDAKKMRRINRKTKENFIYRTVIVTAKLDSNTLNVLTEIEKYYKEMLVELVKYAIDKRIVNYKQLCKEKARELKNKYRGLPTHYINTAIKDATRQASEFLLIKEKGKAYTDYPEIKNVTIWLDDHLWKLEGYTRLWISTHKGRIELEIEPHKHYWKYRNSKDWELVKECQIKIDRKNKRLLVYLKFRKQRVSEPYISQDHSFISVDVNVNNITILIGKAHISNADKNNNIKVQIDGKVYLFETDIEETVNGYYYRRKSIQEKYDKLFGIGSREKKKPMKKLKEKQKKKDIIYKIANIIVREAIKRNAIIIIRGSR